MYRSLTALLLLFLLFLGEAYGERNSIVIRATGQPDTWTLENIVSSVTEGLSCNRDKALALHKFGMDHQIHFVGPREDDSYVSDALKTLSVYGYSLCGINSAAMSALYNLAGMKARRRFITGHVVPEIFFDGSWNYIDTDMFGYVLKEDGSLASVDELLENPDLFDNPVRPDPFFPYDGPENMKRAFVNTDGLRDCHPYSLSHILSLNLRSHERVACYYRPQRRYYVHPGQMQNRLSPSWPRYWIDGPLRENSLAWTDERPPAYGNALFEYKPELTSEAFLRENERHSGLVANQDPSKPQLTAAKTRVAAELILEVSTPWVIAGLMNDPTDFQDNTEGAVASGWFWRLEESDENKIEVSVDGGRTWRTVWDNRRLGAVPFRVDVTGLVEGRYSYLLRFQWIDRAGSGRVGLQDLKLETWVELSPMALPHLEPGHNMIAVSLDNSKAHFVESRWHESGELYGQSLTNLELNPEFPFLRRIDQNRPGNVVFDLGTDKTVKELRLSIRAGCAENEKPQNVKAQVLISEDNGASWEELSRFTVDPEHQQPWMWFNYVLKDRQLDGSKTRMKVVVQNGSLGAIKVGCRIGVVPRVPSDLSFTHVWTEGERFRSTKSVMSAVRGNHSYTIDTSRNEKLINRQLIIEAWPPDTAE